MKFSTGVDEVLSLLLEWLELATGVEEVDTFY